MYSEYEIRWAMRKVMESNAIIWNPFTGRAEGIITNTNKQAQELSDKLLSILKTNALQSRTETSKNET